MPEKLKYVSTEYQTTLDMLAERLCTPPEGLAKVAVEEAIQPRLFLVENIPEGNN